MTSGTAAFAKNYSAVESMRKDYGIPITNSFVAWAYCKAGLDMTPDGANLIHEAKKLEVEGKISISENRVQAESQAEIAIFDHNFHYQNDKKPSNRNKIQDAA